MKNLITVNGGTIGFIKRENGIWIASKTAHFRNDETLAVGKTKKIAMERYIERYFA
jgi:hypothetical protein